MGGDAFQRQPAKIKENQQQRIRVDKKSGSRDALKLCPAILLAILGLYLLLRTDIVRPSIWAIALGAILLLSLTSLLLPFGARTLFFATFGDVGYVQIFPPELEGRIRSRYKSEIGQLTPLEFSYGFSVGQTFPVVNLILIFPAIVLLMMWWKREVITLCGVKEFLVGRAIYTSSDKTTFAAPSGLGIVYYTQVLYGPVLVTTNYGSNHESTSPLGLNRERHAFQGASVGDTWAAHQQLVHGRIANGAEIDRDMSFKAYVAINS